jgi:hypothetical protein
LERVAAARASLLTLITAAGHEGRSSSAMGARGFFVSSIITEVDPTGGSRSKPFTVFVHTVASPTEIKDCRGKSPVSFPNPPKEQSNAHVPCPEQNRRPAHDKQIFDYFWLS